MPNKENEVPQKRFLGTREASLYTGIPIATLRSYRYQGKGPDYTKPVGRALYKVTELDRFMESGRRTHGHIQKIET